MGPSQCLDACALSCTAQTTTSSSLVAVLLPLWWQHPLSRLSAPHIGVEPLQCRGVFSFEIIIVNSELTISFFTETFFSKWPPPTTTTSPPPFPSSWAQTFGSGNRRWGTTLSPSTSGALPLALPVAPNLRRQLPINSHQPTILTLTWRG